MVGGPSMKPLTKIMWRNIGGSIGRFIAIILIILLGTEIFVGVKSAGPALNDSMSDRVTKAHLSDVQLFSSTGFTAKDIKTAESVSGAQAETVKFKYAVGGKEKAAIALYGYSSQNQQNRLILKSGHLPKAANELVLDQQAKKSGYRLGQTFTFAKNADLKRTTYKIVGFADSPQYIDNESRGSANIGDGTVRLFAYIPQKQMNLSTATQLNVRFKKLQNDNTYSSTYKTNLAAKEKALKRVFKTRALQRTTQLTQQIDAQFDTQQQKLDQASKQLTALQSQAATAQSTQLTAQAQQLALQQAQLTQAKTKAQKAAQTTYTWQTRNDLPGFEAYGESSDRIAAIANVFPVFFFLIAALITFTTITRMVEEGRSQIGTFKALGYRKRTIARNYVVYALMAGLIGAILGSVSGNMALPRIVLALYKQYIAIPPVVHLQWPYILMAILISLVVTVGAAGLVVHRELSSGPAELMRPRAPKSAKRILMERITPLWSRMNFNHKVSYRNLFRFKSRLFMTIIGIAGGTALILTGFGIQSSISASGTRQYGEVFNYQATVRLKNTAAITKAKKVLQADTKYRSALSLSANSGKVKAHGEQVNDVNIYVPKQTKSLDRYIRLKDAQSGKKLTLPNSGLVLTKKTANLLDVKKGDTLNVTTTDGHQATIKVQGITQNFTGHFMYLSQKAYRLAFHQTSSVNTLLVRLKSQTDSQRNQLAKQLLDSDSALGTSYTATEQSTIAKMSNSLGPIVAIFVLLSGILSFVVLYNLTNINISERIRELSTVKVLGFYDREVTLYISRENIILTVAGIIVGYAVGLGLTAYILRQAATATVIFPLTIPFSGYLIATLLMIIFTLIVMFVTHKKLQRIDMIDALGSNE